MSSFAACISNFRDFADHGKIHKHYCFVNIIMLHVLLAENKTCSLFASECQSGYEGAALGWACREQLSFFSFLPALSVAVAESPPACP